MIDWRETFYMPC